MLNKIKFNPKQTAYINAAVLILEIIWYAVEGFEIRKLLKTLSYYTNFNQSMVVLYQIWSILEGFKYQQNSIKLRKFSTFLLFQCICVMLGFITIYTISPNAIISKRHPISPYILWTFHLGNVIYMCFIIIFSDGLVIPDKKVSQAALIPSALYILIVLLNLFESGRLPYPFLKHFESWQGVVLIITFIAILNLIFQLICVRYNNKQISNEYDKYK